MAHPLALALLFVAFILCAISAFWEAPKPMLFRLGVAIFILAFIISSWPPRL